MFFINHKEIEQGRATVVEIEGPLNSETSPDFDDYIRKLIENGTKFLIIDLKKLSFISSEGIGAALMVHKKINAETGTTVFCNLNSEVTALFRILGFDKIFTIADNITEALDMTEGGIDLKSPEPYESMEFPDNKIMEEEPDSGVLIEPELPEPELADFDEPFHFNDDFEIIHEETIEPFVIECLKCGSLVRINEKGEHICPFCEAEFNVADDGKALFKIDGAG